MNWGGWQAFLEMGGYGRYVWPAYGGLALAVAVEIVLLRARAARARRLAIKSRAARRA